MPEDGEKRDAYWASNISVVTDGKVFVRGYDLEDLIGALPFTAAVFLLIRGRIPTPAEARVLDAVLTAVLDYSLEKPGTVAARYTVSANPSMAAGMAAACMAVGQFTLATEDTSRFIVDSYREYGKLDLPMDAYAEQLVQRLREEKKRIPGLGHPVFKKIDPRAETLKRIAVKEGLWSREAELYEAVHRAFTRSPGKSDIPINDVGVMAAVLTGLGFTPDEGTGIAVLSTLPGVIAHVSEELQTRRPIRIIPRDDVVYGVATDRDFNSDFSSAGWEGAPE